MKPKTWKSRALTAERLLRKQYKRNGDLRDLYWKHHDEWTQNTNTLRANLAEAVAQNNYWKAMLGQEIDEDRIITGWPGPVLDAISGKAYGTPSEFIQAVRDRRALAAAGGVDVRATVGGRIR